MFALALAVVAVFGVANAAPNPTEPSSTSVFNVGQTCSVKWDPDSTGSWKNMSIQLMTGDNWNMIHITTVAQGIDATDPTKNTFTYTCPDVTPNSAIYFYQFSDSSDPKNLLWTTRWTLASADGQTTTPTETTQPDGQKIPWGKGALVDPSKAVPAPAYLSGTGQSAGTGSSSASGSAAASTPAGTSASAAATTPAAGAATTSAAASSSATTLRAATTRASASGSASAASSTPSANAAVGAAAPGVLAMLGAVMAAVGLF